MNSAQLSAVDEPVASPSVRASLVRGTSALSAATILERGFSFLANLLAARMGGASVFGAYSLAVSTANNISSYAGAGIGNTTTRFAGEHPRESSSYRTIAKAVMVVSCGSAAIAAALLYFSAAPLASAVLKNDGLTALLQLAAISAAAVVLNESARGFFIGQRNHRAVLLLSLLAGGGLLFALPALSVAGPAAMIAGQGAVVLAAVLICVLLSRPLGLAPLAGRQVSVPPLGPAVREVWTFGFAQLMSFVAMNAAGWWLTSRIARTDSSLVQVGLFAVALQMRNMVALVPGLLSQSSYAMMTRAGRSDHGGSEHILSLSTFGSVLLSLILAGSAVLVLPWVLPFVYGASYRAAVEPASFALMTAVVHMGSAPLAGRLTLCSLKQSTIINTIWGILVALTATFFVTSQHGATNAAVIYLGAHLFSTLALLAAFRQHAPSPAGLRSVLGVGLGGAVLLALLAALRTQRPEWMMATTLAMAAALAGSVVWLGTIGKLHGWLPELRPALAAMKPSFLRRHA